MSHVWGMWAEQRSCTHGRGYCGLSSLLQCKSLWTCFLVQYILGVMSIGLVGRGERFFTFRPSPRKEREICLLCNTAGGLCVWRKDRRGCEGRARVQRLHKNRLEEMQGQRIVGALIVQRIMSGFQERADLCFLKMSSCRAGVLFSRRLLCREFLFGLREYAFACFLR